MLESLFITDVLRPPGRPVYRFGDQTLPPKKQFSIFFFQLYFNKKYDEVAINDLTMHLIISKRFRRQKCRQKSKAVRQKEVEAKEQTVYKKVFIHLNTNRSRECSLFLLRK